MGGFGSGFGFEPGFGSESGPRFWDGDPDGCGDAGCERGACRHHDISGYFLVTEKEFLIENLLVRIHFIIEMI